MSKRDTILGRRHETTKDRRNSNVFDQKRAKDSASVELEMQKTSLEESWVYGQELESSLKSTLEENDELSMQLTESLLTMEEEKAIWMSKEKASVQVLEERTKLYTAEISMLSEELLQVRNELGICVKYSNDIEERLRMSEEEASSAKCSGETLSVVALTSDEPRASDDESERYIEEGMILKLKHELAEQNDKFTSLEAQIHKDQITHKENAKLRTSLRGTQAKLDSFRIKYEHSMEEMEHMDKRFREAEETIRFIWY